MDKIELVTEAFELLTAVAILGAWIGGLIETDTLVGQIVVLAAVVAIFGDAAIKVIRLRTGSEPAVETPE